MRDWIAGTKPPDRERALMFGVMLVVAIGNTGLQSVLPAIGRTLRIPDPAIGMAFSLSALVWAITAPMWARRLQMSGTRKLVLIGLTGYTVSLLLCGSTLSFGIVGAISGSLAFAGFVFGRAIYGAFGSAASAAAQAIVALRSSREERTQALTILASAFGLGTVLGPALAPFFLLPIIGLAGPALVFAAGGIAMITLVSLALAERAPGPVLIQPYAEPEMGSDPDDVLPANDSVGEPRRVVRFFDRRIRFWMAAGLVVGNAQALIVQTLAFFIIDLLKLSPTAAQSLIGLVLMTGAGASLLGQWGLIPRLNLDPKQMMLVGCCLTLVGCFGIATARGLHPLTLSYALTCLGFGFARPAYSAGASLAVDHDEQGLVAGHVTAINGFAFVVAPSAGVMMYTMWHPLPYLAAAAAVFVLIPVCITIKPPRRD